MPAFIGSTKIKEFYIGSTKLKELYCGSTKIWSGKIPAGTVIFESSTTGTYTVELSKSQNYEVLMVGGGSGAAQRFIQPYGSVGGGSGAFISGTTFIEKGTYTVVVGAGGYGGDMSGAGEATTFIGQSAGGGTAGIVGERWPGQGGSYTVTLEGLTGINGNSGSDNGHGGASRYEGHGAGGWYRDPGEPGYIKITAA